MNISISCLTRIYTIAFKVRALGVLSTIFAGDGIRNNEAVGLLYIFSLENDINARVHYCQYHLYNMIDTEQRVLEARNNLNAKSM